MAEKKAAKKDGKPEVAMPVGELPPTKLVKKDLKVGDGAEAKKGDATFQAKEEVIILAKEISIKSNQATNINDGSGGMKLTGKDVTIKSSGVMKIEGPKIEMNGSAADAAKAEGTVSEVPDPLK